MYSGVLAISLLLGPQAARNTDAKTTAAQGQAATHQGQHVPAETIPPDPVYKQPTETTTNNYQCPPYAKPQHWWDYNWLGFLLAAVGLMGNGIGLRYVYRQLKANEAAAKAATKSAEAFARAERPYLFFEIEVVSQDGPINVYACNQGRTPAEVVWSECEWRIEDHTFQFPKEPPYIGKNVTFAYSQWIPKDKRGIVFVQPTPRELVKAGASLAGVQSFLEVLYYIGVVRYTSTFDREDVFESRFCYKWNINTIIPSGPANYHNHT